MLHTCRSLPRECEHWPGLPSGQILNVLKGAAPVSRGVAARELEAVQAALKNAGIRTVAFRGKPPSDVLNDLRAKNEVGGAYTASHRNDGHRLRRVCKNCRR